MVVLALLCLVVILLLLLTGDKIWILLMLILGVFFLFWYLPRLIDLQQIPGDVPLAEGPGNGEDLPLSLDYGNWQKGEEDANEEENSFYFLVLLCVLVTLTAAFIVFWWG